MADPRLLSSLGIAGSGWGTQAPQFSAPWGKSAPDGSWHSVIGHSLDVAVVAHRLMGQPVLHARLSAAFGCPLAEAQLDRLAVLTGIHDGGKCLAGFQAKLTHRLTMRSGACCRIPRRIGGIAAGQGRRRDRASREVVP